MRNQFDTPDRQRLLLQNFVLKAINAKQRVNSVRLKIPASGNQIQIKIRVQ
jgi:hypothetical protein